MFHSSSSVFLRLPRFLPRYRFMATAPIGDWEIVETQGSVPYRVYTKPLVKSGQDDRDYRIIHLKNGLQATLVSDAKADKAAASLDVAVGHLSDPVSPQLCSPRKQLTNCARMTCLDSLTFVNISSSWSVPTLVLQLVKGIS
jgi:hypothetical protein